MNNNDYAKDLGQQQVEGEQQAPSNTITNQGVQETFESASTEEIQDAVLSAFVEMLPDDRYKKFGHLFLYAAKKQKVPFSIMLLLGIFGYGINSTVTAAATQTGLFSVIPAILAIFLLVSMAYIVYVVVLFFSSPLKAIEINNFKRDTTKGVCLFSYEEAGIDVPKIIPEKNIKFFSVIPGEKLTDGTLVKEGCWYYISGMTLVKEQKNGKAREEHYPTYVHYIIVPKDKFNKKKGLPKSK